MPEDNADCNAGSTGWFASANGPRVRAGVEAVSVVPGVNGVLSAARAEVWPGELPDGLQSPGAQQLRAASPTPHRTGSHHWTTRTLCA